MDQSNNRTMLNTKETADFLGIKPETLEVWRCRGFGPRYLKIGRLVRYRQADIETFIEDRMREGR